MGGGQAQGQGVRRLQPERARQDARVHLLAASLAMSRHLDAATLGRGGQGLPDGLHDPFRTRSAAPGGRPVVEHPGSQARPGGTARLTVPLAAVLAPGYAATSEQPIVRAMAAQLEARGITARAISYSRARPAGVLAAEIDDVRRARDELLS